MAEIRAVTSLPLVAGGGVVRPEHVAAALAAGADAVAVGTALLLAPEAGTAPANRAALTEPWRGDASADPGVHRASRRAAYRTTSWRGTTTTAPLGYPALHYLTSPIRRASAAQGDPEQVNVWAGSGYREITARPAAEILADLAARA